MNITFVYPCGERQALSLLEEIEHRPVTKSLLFQVRLGGEKWNMFKPLDDPRDL